MMAIGVPVSNKRCKDMQATRSFRKIDVTLTFAVFCPKKVLTRIYHKQISAVDRHAAGQRRF